MTTSSKVPRLTTVDLVADMLRKKILNGDLLPGQPLRQDALSEELGVSIAPIREAITRLHGEGFVEAVPRKGAFVRALSVHEAKQAFEIRLRLEPWLFCEAIPRTGDAVYRHAARIVETMDDVAEDRWPHLNWEFHTALYEPSGLHLVLDMLTRLNDRNSRYFRFQVVNVPIKERTRREHLELIEASRARDTARATKLLRAHLEEAMEDMVSVAETFLNRQSRKAINEGRNK